jgi:hypothetical protein
VKDVSYWACSFPGQLFHDLRKTLIITLLEPFAS